MAHDVFLSYSAQDKEAAEAVCRVLEAHSVKVWMAHRDIEGGAPWSESIPTAIEQARAVLLIFSKNADTSEWVPREIEIAVDRKKRIIPFRLTNTEPTRSLELFVKTLHRLDGFPPPLEQHLPKLADQTRQILGIRQQKAQVVTIRPAEAQQRRPPRVEPPPLQRTFPRRGLVAGGIVLSAAAVFAGYLFQGFGDPPSATPLAHADSLPGGSNDPENCQTSEGFLAGDESESSALPGFDHVEGAFLVKDVRTLVVKNRLVKLAGVGIGEPDSAERLRMWLAANASTVACVPVDLRRCEYSCNAGSGNNDIATRILESRWASPSR